VQKPLASLLLVVVLTGVALAGGGDSMGGTLAAPITPGAAYLTTVNGHDIPQFRGAKRRIIPHPWRHIIPHRSVT
jgi:hypothetical protein